MIRKVKNRILVFNIISDVFCVLMIPFIPIGFINMDKKYMLALAIVGIVCAIFLMYGTVFFWLLFAKFNRRARIYNLITEEELYNVCDIAKLTNKEDVLIEMDISYLIRADYLNGFYFDGKTLIKKSDLKKRMIKPCPNCGASDNLELQDNVFYCKYCNSKY